MEEILTNEELKALRVVDLKKILSKLGLEQKGVKAELISRLDNYYEQIRNSSTASEENSLEQENTSSNSDDITKEKESNVEEDNSSENPDKTLDDKDFKEKGNEIECIQEKYLLESDLKEKSKENVNKEQICQGSSKEVNKENIASSLKSEKHESKEQICDESSNNEKKENMTQKSKVQKNVNNEDVCKVSSNEEKEDSISMKDVNNEDVCKVSSNEEKEDSISMEDVNNEDVCKVSSNEEKDDSISMKDVNNEDVCKVSSNEEKEDSNFMEDVTTEKSLYMSNNEEKDNSITMEDVCKVSSNEEKEDSNSMEDVTTEKSLYNSSKNEKENIGKKEKSQEGRIIADKDKVINYDVEKSENNYRQFKMAEEKARPIVFSAAPSIIKPLVDLEDVPTPAGPANDKKKKGPVPLMSLSLSAPNNEEKLPKALEEALALTKDRGNIREIEPLFPPNGNEKEEKRSSHFMEVENSPESKKDKKNTRRKKKVKRRKIRKVFQYLNETAENEENDIEIEYIQEKMTLASNDPMYRQYTKVFEAFKIPDAEDLKRMEEERDRETTRKLREDFKKVPKQFEEDDMIEEREDDDEVPKLSKRKLKKLNRLSVAELKQLVSRPDVVEMHDVTAWDPRLLVHLKSTRNTVPVPRHWCFKRKYLQGKRGIEKPPFNLPDFIKRTGIMEMRAALQEKEDTKGLKAKMREKVRPKMGKIDIDYQKLHDAFFKWQTKPKMTGHGDLYYEGKEFEIRLKEKKPGELSDSLRTALGMPVGPNAHKVPPPWLIAMQRYGPPPSYPNLKIPGLNSPIPDGCSFGYHAGGWGKPPVDEMGKPLYGDVFGTSDSNYNSNVSLEEVDQRLWGEMESESEDEESEDEEEEVEGGGADVGGHSEKTDVEKEAENLGIQTPIVTDAGLATPSGLSSVSGLAGLETPELIELRKKRIESDMENNEEKTLYTVLSEKRNERIGSSMMGSSHIYETTKSKSSVDQVPLEMALNPEEVDLMDTEAMQLRAEAAIREQAASLAKEDLSDMVAEHAAKQSSKRKRIAAKDDKTTKKYKEFKF